MISILDKIRQAGGTIAVVGNDLRLRVPKGLLTDDDRRLLAEHKAEIVRLLAEVPVIVESPVDAMIEPVVEADLDQHDEAVELTTAAGMKIRFADQDLDDEAVVAPSACSCGNAFLFWFDLVGRHHCSMCERTTSIVVGKDFPRTIIIDSARLRQQAARLRRQRPCTN